MKKVTFLSVLLVVSFIASSQEKIDALSFIETFDWKTTPTDFQARNEKIILPKTDSLYALWGTEEAYIINDLDIDGIGFYAVVNFLGGNNFCYPVIFMCPSNSTTDLSAQKIFDSTKLHINKRYGETEEITSTKNSQIIPVSDSSRELIWEKKFFRLSLSMNYVNNAEIVFLSVMPDVDYFFSEDSTTKAESYSPEIQNKFLGLTLGNKYSTEQVKALAIERGSFLKIEKVSNINKLCFNNFYFGGHKWDFCNFWLNQNGEFYMFEVYCSYELGSMYKEEAESLFNNTKKSISKYGDGITSDSKDGTSLHYYGSNNISISLSNSREKSAGGEYRRYVKLIYLESTLLKGVLTDIESDF